MPITAHATALVLAHSAGHGAHHAAGHAAGHADGAPAVFTMFLLSLPVLVVAALVLRSRDQVTAALCLFSAGAGAIHAVVTPEHLREDVRFGVFFLVVTALQFVWIVSLLRRSSSAPLLLGVAGNLAVLAVWAVSRTIGLPFGPEAGQAEPVGLLDLACGAYEAAIVAGCLWLARPVRLPAGGRPAALAPVRVRALHR